VCLSLIYSTFSPSSFSSYKVNISSFLQCVYQISFTSGDSKIFAARNVLFMEDLKSVPTSLSSWAENTPIFICSLTRIVFIFFPAGDQREQHSLMGDTCECIGKTSSLLHLSTSLRKEVETALQHLSSPSDYSFDFSIFYSVSTK
jgi:hypothetical protein